MTPSGTCATLIFGGVFALVSASGRAQVSQATVAVDGMSCPFCAYGVEKRLAQVPGVDSVEVTMGEGSASLTAAEGASIDVARIPQAVRQAGFTPGDIEVVATGRVGDEADGGWWFELGDSNQRLLLVNPEGELAGRVAALAGSATRVRVTGGLHFHSDASPGLEPSAMEEMEETEEEIE